MWQPIETAPKDGTHFLVLMEEAVYRARYDRSNPQRFCVLHHAPFQSTRSVVLKATYEGREVEAHHEIERGPWQSEPHWSIWVAGWDFKPTHWMPLPEPPKAP